MMDHEATNGAASIRVVRGFELKRSNGKGLGVAMQVQQATDLAGLRR